MDEQGFDAPGVDALYDLQYDPQVRERAVYQLMCGTLCVSLPPVASCLYLLTSAVPQEVINLLRSPYVHKPLTQLHADAAGTSHGKIVPFDRAQSLQGTLVGWLERTGSEYASSVEKRQMNTSHINQVPMLAGSIAPEITWQVNKDNTLSLPAGLFLDVDGDRLAYGGVLDRSDLPDWLEVDAKNGSVHGKPSRKGSHLLRITATDQKVGFAFVELLLTVE